MDLVFRSAYGETGLVFECCARSYVKAGLELESEILNWSKGQFGIAMVPKPAQVDTELGVGLIMIQQVSDRSAAEKAFTKLDSTMAQQYSFKIAKVQIGGKDAIDWVSPLSGTMATHGWLDRNLAFVSLGAPVASTFVPQPQSRLSDHPLFQEATRWRSLSLGESTLNNHNGQFFIDVDRTINAGNLALPALSPEVLAGFKAVRSLGVTSAVFDESSNRFDLFIGLKKVPGIAKLPPASPKSILLQRRSANEPAPTPIKPPIAVPNLATPLPVQN